MNQNLRKVRFFRNVDGSRVPFTLVLDEKLNEVSLTRDHEAYTRVVYGTDATASKMTLWSTIEVPNPIPGTDDLRARYAEARKKLEVSVAEGECLPCAVGKLTTRYRTILEGRGLLP